MRDDDTNPFLDNSPGESELTCWKDGARYCADDCVAYEDKCEGDPRFSPCLLLNIQRAQAKSFANIAQELKRHNDWEHRHGEEMREFQETMRQRRHSKEESMAYALKLKEMDPGPPEIR